MSAWATPPCFALCSSGGPAGRMTRLALSAVGGAAVDFHRHRSGRRASRLVSTIVESTGQELARVRCTSWMERAQHVGFVQNRPGLGLATRNSRRRPCLSALYGFPTISGALPKAWLAEDTRSHSSLRCLVCPQLIARAPHSLRETRNGAGTSNQNVIA